MTSACCASAESPIRGPVKIVVHHRKDVGDFDERLDAGIPFFFGESGRESVALQAYVFPEPAFCLHHLERVGRCDENLGKKRVRIERDGRHKLVELGFVQTRLSGLFEAES